MDEHATTSATTEIGASQPVVTTGGQRVDVQYHLPKLDGLGYTVIPHPPTPRDS